MPRTWKKSFILFVIILILLPLWRVVIPRYAPSSATRAPNSIHTNFVGVLPHNLADLNESWNRYRRANWTEGWEVNTPQVSRGPTTYTRSIEDLNRITDLVSSHQTNAYPNRVRPPTSLTPHGPIIIQSDADFASQGWPGNGTQANPYHIANLHITVAGTCVQINNTQAHFVISNCWVERDSSPEVAIGIILTNVTNGFIANTTFTRLDSGVIIRSSEANELLNNSCSNTETGFMVFSSNTTNLINNTCIDTEEGIYVRESNALRIYNNTCLNSDFGILVFDSSSTQIINNTIKNSRFFGCEIYPVNDNILANNSLVSCGFFFGSWLDMRGAPSRGGVGSIVDVEAQITGNTVNQRALILWLWRVGGTVPLGGGQVILLNCSYVTVHDQSLTDASIGVFLCFSTRSWVFNNTCTGHSVNGMRIQNCDGITVNNNRCMNNSKSGITIDQTFNTILTENMCNHNAVGCGIFLFESYDNQLLRNICNHNRYGISLLHSWGTELLNNTCNHNQAQMMWGEGIVIFGDANLIGGNLCNDNTGAGINITGNDNNALENTCSNNLYGIVLDSSISQEGTTSTISNNLCVNNRIGIYIQNYNHADYGQAEIAIIDNTMISCGLLIYWDGGRTVDFEISGNTVNGRPLIFFQNRENSWVPSGAGQIILFNCRGITVRGQTLTDCSTGLLVYNTSHSLFVDNILGDNAIHGIQVHNSHNNHFTRNLFTNNDSYGIYLHGNCRNNSLDWNIFIGNANHNACDQGPNFQSPGANIFDCNYWANYTGYDLNWDSYGDIPYNVTGNADNRDLHPLMTPFAAILGHWQKPLFFLLEGYAILIIVIVVVILVRMQLRRLTPSSTSNHRSTGK